MRGHCVMLAQTVSFVAAKPAFDPASSDRSFVSRPSDQSLAEVVSPEHADKGRRVLQSVRDFFAMTDAAVRDPA